MSFDNILITGLSGRTCHNVQSVDVIHNNSIAAVTSADTDRCRTCHVDGAAIPTTKNCEDAACHGGVHAEDHMAPNSAECVNCHDAATDVRSPHANQGDGCNVCHGGGGYPMIHVGKTADCAQADCHISMTPVYTSHYVGSETSHTAGSTQASSTLDVWPGTPSCDECHRMNLGTEHSAASAAKTTDPSNYCANCHLSTTLPLSPSVVVDELA